MNSHKTVQEMSKEEIAQILGDMHKDHVTDPEVLVRSRVGDFDQAHPWAASFLEMMMRFRGLLNQSNVGTTS